MRKFRAVVFLATGILLGLLFLDSLSFLTSGDTTRYVIMALSAAGSIACGRAALADWRPVGRADSGNHVLRRIRKSSVPFAVAGTLLGLLVALEVRNLFDFHNRSWVRNAPWSTRGLLFLFPLVFALGAVACFRATISLRRARRTTATGS